MLAALFRFCFLLIDVCCLACYDNSMKYFFVLGNHPELSIAEIYTVLSPADRYQLASGVLIVETDDLNANDLIKRLGGTIKIGEIKETIVDLGETNVKAAIKKILAAAEKPFFGISLYGGAHNFTPLALTLKKEIKIKDRSPRYVVSREPVLSSVVVEQNKLTSGGAEIVFIKSNNSYLVGRTLAVQPFKELSKRDYGRPNRDDASGMLPPKLAQIMINLSDAHTGASPERSTESRRGVLLDPFCGSGTVLTEGALLGFSLVCGSDISNQAIADSRRNFDWVKDRYRLDCLCEFKVGDAREINKLWSDKKFDAIVFEGYLGPQRGAVNWPKVLAEYSSVYQDFFSAAHKLLSTGQRLVAALPYVHSAKGDLSIKLDLSAWRAPSLRPTNFKLSRGLSARDFPIYGRLGQKVFREIIVLEK